jgi:hypothetical protein
VTRPAQIRNDTAIIKPAGAILNLSNGGADPRDAEFERM